MGLRYVWEKWNIDSRYTESTRQTTFVASNEPIYYKTESVSVSDTISSGYYNTSKLEVAKLGIIIGKYQSIVGVSWGHCTAVDDTKKHRINYYSSEPYELSYKPTSKTICITQTINGEEVEVPFTEGYITTVYSKGSTSYGNVSSANSGTYPANSYSGSYWYVSLGSDTIDPVSLTYTDPVQAGGTVNLTITPSSGIVHGGTVTYTIQTTTNGEDWYDAGTTTGTTFAVTVPQDAAIWNVRVYAKDDTGFVSSTYVYGNNIPTWVTVIQSEIVPASGDLGYLTSKNIVAVGVTHVSEQTYSISATLNGEPCFEKSGVAITDATYIILEDETWESIPQETEQTLDVTITFTGSADTRNYTFKKFTYDDTSLQGVMEGMARAIRIKREYDTQILGKNMPKEIIKVDNPVNTSGLKEATASEAQVFKGYTFFAGDSELRTGVALSEPTNITADNLPNGLTAYNDLGQLVTGKKAYYEQLHATQNLSVGYIKQRIFTVNIPKAPALSVFKYFYNYQGGPSAGVERAQIVVRKDQIDSGFGGLYVEWVTDTQAKITIEISSTITTGNFEYWVFY